MDLDRVGMISSDVAFFWLGEYVVSTLSKGVEDFYCGLYKMVRQWSVDFVVRKLLKLMVIVNPQLSSRQQACLKPILSRALDQLLWQRTLDPSVMRGIVALACPNQDTGLLFGYLMEIIAGLVCSGSEKIDGSNMKSSHTDVESAGSSLLQVPHEKMRVAQLLFHRFSVEQVYVAAMPSTVRRVVLAALAGGKELPSAMSGLPVSSTKGSQHLGPICCITLEPLLCPNGSISPDVVAVIQRSSTLGKNHAFLYRGHALYAWLGSSQIPRNPETRSVVLPTDVYRLS